MEQRYGFNLNVRDHAGQNVQIPAYGTVQRHGGGPDPQRDGGLVQSALYQAANVVVGQAVGAGQVGLPTLAHSLPHFLPQIEQAANAHLAHSGIQLNQLTMQVNVPQSAIAPAAAAIAAAPSPLESAAQNFGENVADSVADSVASRIPSSVNVGGFRIGAGQNLGDQLGDKVKGEILHYVILAGVALFVAFICCGSIAFKLFVD